MEQYDEQRLFRKPVKFDRVVVPVEPYRPRHLRMVVALGVAGWIFAIGIVYVLVRWLF